MNKKTTLVTVIAIILFASILMWSRVDYADDKFDAELIYDDSSVIIDAIMHEKGNLRYDAIKNYIKTNESIDVTDDQINEAFTELANRKDTTSITKTSFLLTLGMLDKHFNDMLWPATHNSFSNDPDGDADISNYLSKEEVDDLGLGIVEAGSTINTENHKLSIRDQLGRGIRMIDVDLGPRMITTKTITGGIGSLIKNAFEKAWEGFKSIFTGGKKPKWDWKDILGDIKVDWNIVESYHRIGFFGRTSINTINNSIKDFLDNNPNEIAVIRVSDLYDGVFGTLNTDDDRFYYLIDKYIDNLKSNGLLSQVINYYGDDNVAWDKRHEYMFYPGDNFHDKTMKEWPALKEMVLQNKRLVLILPTYNKIKGDPSTSVKNTDNTSFSNPSGGSDKPYKASIAHLIFDDKKAEEYKNAPYRVLKIDPINDDNIPAGSYEAAKQNNNGRRIYDLVKEFNKRMKDAGVNRVVNFVGLDYFMGDKSKGGIRDVDVVDAANRINFENIGLSWETMKTLNKNLYWNYFNRDEIYINQDIKSAETNIDGHKGIEFIDKNVWTGTESQNIKDKYLKVEFNNNVIISKVYLNFFSYTDTVPFEVKIKKDDGTEYDIGRFEFKQNRLSDWYEIPVEGDYEASEVIIYFRGTAGLHFKEVAFKGGRPSNKWGEYKTENIVPVADSYVLWGDHIGKNYHYDDYRRNNLEMYKSSINARHVFMKFDMSPLRTPTKDIFKAYLVFDVTDVGSNVDIVVKEDRDAIDWQEDTLTGNIAKHWDDNKDVKSFRIQSNGYVKVDITDGIKNYLASTDQDNLMTFRIYTNSGDWFVIKSRHTSDKPKLEILYKDVKVEEKTLELKPEQDSYVKWGDYSKYNYGTESILQIYNSKADSKNSKTTFMKFGMEQLIGKKIISAKLQYTIKVGDPTVIAIREDIDASNWAESRVNGNEAKHWDEYNMIASSIEYDKTTTDTIDVTNVVANFVKRNDVDNKITFRFYQPWHSAWTYIYDRNSSTPPKLIVKYSD
ncbi:hypothetical protein PV797_04740 [Clostridiaceae bacterium M8S5]|nr:hypothetical protein PV797_04740 [Clostridiaceae bacterium M8S5]